MFDEPENPKRLRWRSENRNLLDIPAVFAGLLTVIVIGLVVENLIFRTIERNTVQKWGTQS
jgi:NitT/TauT family transport system permease protein